MMEKELATSMGLAMRQARRRMAMTQGQVAKLAGINYEYYSRLERGVQLPSTETLAAIYRVTDVCLDVALGGKCVHTHPHRTGKPLPRTRAKRNPQPVQTDPPPPTLPAR